MSMYKLLATLSSAKIDYVLVGGLAVTLHGYERLTMGAYNAKRADTFAFK